ncbi:MAG: hypothetical protein KBD21_03940 [Candidatus Pacebacteria bacterium]|nr:hypothetical protein [Candidatus Paceibacterota bacterium]
MLDENSSIERVRRKLYARQAPQGERERRTLYEDQTIPVSQAWETEADIPQTEGDFVKDAAEELEELRHGVVRGVNDNMSPILMFGKVAENKAKKRKQKGMFGGFVSTIFFSSLVFFLLAGGYAIFLLGKGGNEVACDKVKIDVLAPTSVPSGKELVLDVTVKNGNPVALEHAELLITYPEGTKNADDPTTPLPTVRADIGTLEVGAEVTKTSRSIPYGTEQTVRTIRVQMEYSLRESERVLTCEREFPFTIATAPVTLSVKGFEEISSGQEFTLTIDVSSNAEGIVPNQRLVVDYPFGFRALRMNPEPTHEQNVWDLGDVPPEYKKEITITGVVDTQTVESRSVKFRMGERDATDATALVSTMKTVEHPLLIVRPFVKLDVELNESTEKVISVSPGGVVNGVIHWKNDIGNPIYDVTIEAVLPRAYLDRTSVKAAKGYFSSTEQRILWTPQTTDELKEVAPGEEGTLDFSFKTESVADTTGARNPEIPISFTVHARRVSDQSEVPQTLTALSPRTVQLNSVPLFAARTYFSVGPFRNTGPYPPRAEQETTYTITWQVKNSVNDLSDVYVSAVLPVYTQWMDQTYPGEEDVSYNPTTRVVTWSLGDVAAATGSVTPPREASFRVLVVPSVTDIGETPVIVRAVTMRGVDVFTRDMVERTVRDHTTSLTDDPAYSRNMGQILE